MDEDYREKRAKKLGFRPQKENVYNSFLPYAEHLDDESEKLFVSIKTNLVKSVLAREMRPGCALWTSRLNKYIEIYGLKFSKEDHIALVKLFYELITIPDLEPTRINKCAVTLSQLLKKKYLLTRDELQLEWRPLYDLCVRTTEKSKSDIGMYRYFSTFESTLFNAVRSCKVYFPASATQEILDEFRPNLCPFTSSVICGAIQYLELFLPVAVLPHEADISYKLWFEEFMSLWDVCHNAGAWENNMMWLLGGLGRFQMGYIDWSPYVSNMFARFQRSLQLPVNFKQKKLSKHFRIDTAAMAVWIVCSLNGDKNTTFFHLEKLLQTLETYFHPANVGRWTMKLRELLMKLSYFFVQRVHCERYKNPSWENNVPEHYKLSDADIDRFVNILKPCVEAAVFSRMGTQEISLVLSYLASLRPNLIVPGLLDKLCYSMCSLTEPHKLTSTMMAVIAVGRHMVQGTHNNYPEGPTHIIPLLLDLLPGIDPNDMRKSYVTFNFILHFVNMIPVIDSSKAHTYYNDLTEEEHMICEASACFEDFVLQFFDRLIVWVDSSSLDFIRLEQTTSNNSKNRSETIAETAVGSVVSVVLTQCSPAIFHSALRKFYNFVTQKILEVQVAGRTVAVVTHCFAIVNPVETLKLFVPYLVNSLEESLEENPRIVEEEHVDARFLFHLLILSEVVDGREALLPYIDKLTNILDKTLHMACVEASQLATRTLELILASLTNVKPIENRSSQMDYGSSVEEFLSVREWAKPQNMKDLKINWYVPKEIEINAAQNLINKYLIPELDTLNKYVSGEIQLNRQKLKCSLKIVVSMLSCHLLLPAWDEPSYKLVDTILDSWVFNLMVIENGKLTMPDGSNIRKAIVDTIHNVQRKLLETDEGDTKSIQLIIYIYNIILFNKGRYQDFELHWKTFHLAKKILEDRLHQKKQHLRHVHIDRVLLQQEFRIECRNCSFTNTHKQIMDDLFELSVSRYSEIRRAAQVKLYTMVQNFPNSFKVLKDKIKTILQMNSIENHETFKGCLYILLGPKRAPIVARHDWDFIKEIWPLLVRSMPSEKPSIVNLITALMDTVNSFFPTIAIKLVIPEKCLTAAYALADTKPFVSDISGFQKHIDNGEEYLKQKSLQRRQAYEYTVHCLLENLEQGNLHWRYTAMAMSFIKNLVHFDVKYSSRVVRFILHSTINESINIRKSAMTILVFIGIQNKPQFEKVVVDPCKFSSSANQKRLIPGEREDNAWLMYNSKTVPNTVQQWEETRYLHDQHTGYFTWPKELKLYAPASKQKSVASRLENMTDIEREIYNFFTNEGKVGQLIKYLSLEEKKGVDRFNAYRFLAFKYIFKMFEDKFLPIILPHIQKLVEDKQESSQRCAAEIVSSLIRGSKHWQFAKVQQLWQTLIPILNTAIMNMGNETVNDWTLSITMGLESRDPNTIHWLLEFLMEDPLKDPTSFVACSRIQILYVAIAQQSWRNAEIFSKLVEYFKPYLAHPFQNIREKISQLLALVYAKDLVFPLGNVTQGPRLEDFFDFVNPKMKLLYKQLLRKNDIAEKSDIVKTCDNLGLINIATEGNEKEELLKLFKIVSKFITILMARVNFSGRPEFFKLLPLAALLQNYESDEEIACLATNLLVTMSETMTVKKYIPDALDGIRGAVKCPLWSARAIIAELLPVFLLHNMPTLQTNVQWILEIQELVLELLEDPQPEVRIEAAKVVSGLLHCQFIPEPTELLKIFKQKSRTKLKKGISTRDTQDASKNLIIRHAGVLGLCSFINAHPYDVPDYLPTVFEALGPHLSDPQPIPATIRKTMGDFKRTHHANWEVHKLKFTEDELTVLSDLSVPPSYYV